MHRFFFHFDVGVILNTRTHFSAQSTNQTHCPKVAEIGNILGYWNRILNFVADIKLRNIRSVQQFWGLCYVIASIFSARRFLQSNVKPMTSSKISTNKLQSQSQNFSTTDGLRPISSTLRQVPWGSRPHFFFNCTLWLPDGVFSYEQALPIHSWVALQFCWTLASSSVS
jgi:hypothetical protein